jgi:hypothetical protein
LNLKKKKIIKKQITNQSKVVQNIPPKFTGVATITQPEKINFNLKIIFLPS